MVGSGLSSVAGAPHMVQKRSPGRISWPHPFRAMAFPPTPYWYHCRQPPIGRLAARPGWQIPVSIVSSAAILRDGCRTAVTPGLTDWFFGTYFGYTGLFWADR